MSDRLPPGMPDPAGDPAAWAQFMSQMQQVFATASDPSAKGAPVNWELARRVALSVAAGGTQEPNDPVTASSPIGPRARTLQLGDDHTEEVLRLADLWLEPTTSFPSGITNTASWSRDSWIDATMPTWQRLCDPVAVKVVEAMSTLLPTELHDESGGPIPREILEQVAGPLGGLSAAFTQIGGALFGAQVGHGLGTLCREVLSATDVGLPLGPASTGALIPTNVEVLAQGLERPVEEVRLYVALREAAHQRLYQHVPWLRSHVLDTVESYARGIQVDKEAFEEAFERMHATIDPSDPSSLEVMVSEQMFRPATTAEQRAALTRLETALALIEGWVVHVVDDAASSRLPGAPALSESFRRRRAAGGPAEQTFATLVGLELRPRRLREAANLWAAVKAKRGVDGRDNVWAHPDLIPSAEDLDDPIGFAERDFSGEIEGFDQL